MKAQILTGIKNNIACDFDYILVYPWPDNTKIKLRIDGNIYTF